MHTVKSMKILGDVLGLEKESKEFNNWYSSNLELVLNVLSSQKPNLTKVFLESRVGLRGGCCETMSNGMLGLLVDAAGGRNIAKKIVLGMHGMVSLEYLLTNQPSVYIATGIGSSVYPLKVSRGKIVLGNGVGIEKAYESLKKSAARVGIV